MRPPLSDTDAPADTEIELISQATDGDARAFATLVAAHRDRAWAVCLRITGHRHDAEDALQDALTAAWCNLSSFRGEALFGTWLHRIAANAALKLVKRRRDVPLDDVADLPTPESTLAVVERDAIASALALIPPEFRAALVLREYADMSYAEIAKAQGVGIQTVKSRLNRARRAVQALLQESSGERT
jgi:RNA polymerase sigma-70 factor (ECF subfamily)